MGTNFFPTKKRKWPGFCERKHKTADGEEYLDYYYRMTACNLLNTPIDLPLDVEPILAGEGEVASAKRMIQRLCDNYTRFFDVIVADALYMEGPFVNFCVERGKDVIIVLKENYPSLIEDARGLFKQIEPEIWHTNGRTIQIWDEEGFKADTVDVPIRVLHTIETYTEKVQVDGEIVEKEMTAQWWWATTIPYQRLRTKQVLRMGRSRWQIENNIFNTLGQHWYLNHCYKHNKVAMVNFVLCLFIIFILVQCFYKRHLKPQMRKIINSLIALSNQLYAGLGVEPSKNTANHSGLSPP
jgi:hypothetical protein